ncbi:hypothetical protein HAX54_023641 [Datura stramonium]|uniref:BZIP domain-containing protein n=1 Tax=Datura stramonium TaxID=4076 RepID=A0ABS8UWK5_DATST|nr:hypothetical protein [Datura stramonium]
MDVVNYPEKITSNVAMAAAATTSNECQLIGERKSPFTDEKVEKSIERRQRRIIKNKESSAARSRARKQYELAYIIGLKYGGYDIVVS